MILQEMKKIWTPTRVLLLILITVLMYVAFLSPILKRFEVRDGIDSFQEKLSISRDWISEYGYYIEPEDFDEIENVYEESIAEISSNMAQKQIFVECGVENYEEFLVYENNAINGKEGFSYEKYKEMRGLLFEGTIYNGVNLQEYRNMIENYKVAAEGHNSILPIEVIIYTTDFLVYVSLWCLACVFLISAPVMVNDVASNVSREQYSSRIGRKIYMIQYLCTMFSVLVTEIIVFCAAMLLWKKTGTLIYSGAGLNSFMYSIDAVFNIRYVDVFALFFAIVLLVGIGVGSITFCLSSRSSNVIAMLMKVIPLAVLAGGYILSLKNVFFENNMIYGLIQLPGIEFVLAVVIALIGVGINAVNYKRIKNN